MGMLTVSPAEVLTLVFTWSPQVEPDSELVLVEAPAVMLTMGNHPAFATLTLMSLLSMLRRDFSISGRDCRAC